MLTQELNVGTILAQSSLLAQLNILLTPDRSETPVLRDNNLLATGELVRGTTEGLDGSSAAGVTGADGQKDLADIHTGNQVVGLAEGATHTGLETISTGAGKHLVDADDVEGVGADAEMETFFTGDFDEIPIPLAKTQPHALRAGGRAYLLAQIRAASNASEVSCSYSFEIICTHSGKSSTLAFLRPRS